MSETAGAIPRVAKWLGLGGLIPFYATLAAAWIAPYDVGGLDPVGAHIAYGAAIASFLGAVHWGATIVRPGGPDPKALIWGVIPSLIAWLALLMPATTALILLAAALVAAWLVDRQAIAGGLFPRWYGRLRNALTLFAVLAIVLMLVRPAA